MHHATLHAAPARDGGGPLREARISAGLNQSELARRAGVAIHRVSRLEGIWGFSVRWWEAEAIAHALDADVDELFGGDVPVELVGTRSRPATPAHQRHSGENGRRAQREAEAYGDAHHLIHLRRAAKEELKVDPVTLMHYVKRGLIAPAETRMFGGLEFHFFRRDEIERFRQWLRSEWASGRHTVRRGLQTLNVPARKRWAGRRAGHKGGPAGIEAGASGGRPAKMTKQQAQDIWRLHGDGLGSRRIAEIVFGHQRFRGRVDRVLKRSRTGS